jgi:hypothetical protein
MSLIRRKDPGQAWETEVDPGGGGVATAGAARVLGPFPFAFDTPNLNDGVEFYTPTPGDILLDAWISVPPTDFWDGTPIADIGQGTPQGLFRAQSDYAPYLVNSDGESMAGTTMTSLSNASGYIGGALGTVIFEYGVPAVVDGAPAAEFTKQSIVVGVYSSFPATFVDDSPMAVWVSQSGQRGDTASGATQGTASVYLVVATPNTV